MRSEASMTNISPSSSTSTLSVLAETPSTITLVPTATSVRWAEDPFKKKSGDVILRSSDALHFRLHKSILGNASLIFEDIFANAKRPPSAAGLKADGEMDGLPVICVEEDGAALTCLLRFYYEPFTLKVSDVTLSPATLCDITLAARKYLMAHAKAKIGLLFHEFCTQRGSYRIATEAYAIATQKGMAQEIRAAAKASLFHIPDYGYSGAFDHIPGSDVLKLIRYRQRCLEAVRAVIGLNESKTLWSFEQWYTGIGLTDSDDDHYHSISFSKRKCHAAINSKSGQHGETKRMPITDAEHQYFLAVTSALQERPHPQVIYDDKHRNLFRFATYSVARERDSPRKYRDSPSQGGCVKDIEAFERMLFKGIQAAIGKVRQI